MKRLMWLILLTGIVFQQAVAHEKKIYIAERKASKTIRLDGVINDKEWGQKGWQSQFTQVKPHEGKQASQKTFFKVLYDDENVYIAIKARDTSPEKIEKRLSRRDKLDGDWVNVTIDSYFDHRTAFAFSVSAAGVKGDYAVTNDGRNWDSTWDAIWYSKTKQNDKGWFTEIRIPLTQLRFADNEHLTWGFQVMRYIFRNQEQSLWQFIPNESSGWVHRFAELKGIKDIKPQKLLAVNPYTVAKTEFYEAEPGNPFSTGRGSNITFGLDGKAGLTNDLTLDYTINPDFGQVEADPSQVNLSAFETYLREKRPFFMEGKSILNFELNSGGGSLGRDNLFYSRRIGRSPQVYPELGADEYADIPGNTTILGAAKLTGKTSNGWSVGILESMTQEETAEIDDEGEPRQAIVEPFTNYFVGRVEKDLNKGNTVMGMMSTATNRRLNSQKLKDELHQEAYTAGLDFKHYWNNKTYYIDARSVFSKVKGSENAIQRTQEASSHFFQREDADHLTLDTTRNSLSGYGGALQVGKEGNGRWRFYQRIAFRSPGLELNDIGYLRSGDIIHQTSWLQYRIWEPFSVFRNFRVSLSQNAGFDFGKTMLYKGINGSTRMEFKNFWNLAAGLSINGNSLDKSKLRGGPAMKDPGRSGIWTYFRTDRRKTVVLGAGSSSGASKYNNSEWLNLWFDVDYRPLRSLGISVRPQVNVSSNNTQYYSTVDYQASEQYLLGQLNRKTFRLSMRVNYSLMPNLSVQYYGQPFISQGVYSGLKFVSDPKATDYTDRFTRYSDQQVEYNKDADEYAIDHSGNGQIDFTVGNNDYQRIDFMSNLVMRWEYMPGSSLYLVWSQSRMDYFTPENERMLLAQNTSKLAGIHPNDVLMMKLSYRLGN